VRKESKKRLKIQAISPIDFCNPDMLPESGLPEAFLLSACGMAIQLKNGYNFMVFFRTTSPAAFISKK